MSNAARRVAGVKKSYLKKLVAFSAMKFPPAIVIQGQDVMLKFYIYL